MTIKRKRRPSPSPKGLAAGEPLKRSKLSGSDFSTWGWVGAEVNDPANITLDHRLATCGFGKRSKHTFCANKYASESSDPSVDAGTKQVTEELDDEVIVISDDEITPCSKKSCKRNPLCLNYLGQEIWEDRDDSQELYLSVCNLGENPMLDSKDPELPVGLKNLGATCYANAFIQVWFRDLAFRMGVYNCQPSQDEGDKFKESPIFQLQVTFAALQEGTQSVYNPTKLVESLQLRTSEQQDAQEFSKLFMSHLDAEFQKQSNPVLRSLVAEQFQGKQVYGTTCENCSVSSEKTSDFLEIEINFEDNSRLEDRISALLQPETLSGDNKYLCSQCDSLQNATRYLELRELPPVLHFSLLRFVYDISSMERKKSKHSITFPSTLNMDQFLGSLSSRIAASHDLSKGDNIYELRGVLLHKGASAYHGHYEAQVWDTTQQLWFQFNDEKVTKIMSLGDQPDKSGDNSDGKKISVQSAKHRAHARKKRRIDDSDDDLELLPSNKDVRRANGSNSAEFSSKDAYMLIYVRRDTPAEAQISGHRTSTSPQLPSRALEVIQSLNAAHDKVCEEYIARQKEALQQLDLLRQKVMDIYRSWSLSSMDEKSIIVSRQALERWLASDAIIAATDKLSTISQEHAVDSSTDSLQNDLAPQKRLLSHITCSHGKLDPQKASDMKCITHAAYLQIEAKTGCSFEPVLTQEDVCADCVKNIFVERLYQIEHPRTVSLFDDVCNVEEDCQGYWISKQWVKDWRLVKPKMHITSLGDPSPDAPEYEGHVKCEHGGLSLNTTSRRRISTEGFQILKNLFPSWDPVSTDSELCATCTALIHIFKEDKREIRRKAEDEKATLKHMLDNSLNGNTALLENFPCAIVPAQFVRAWRQWLFRPADVARPEIVDNSIFICQHGLLNFDPNCEIDMDASVTMIRRNDWNILENLYPGGPLIDLEKCMVETDDGKFYSKFVHEIQVCDDCRLQRKRDFDVTDVTIRVLKAEDPLPKPGLNEIEQKETQKSSRVTYGSQRSGTVRQSKRIRQVKDRNEKRKMTVHKDMSVKDVKIWLQDQLDIPTICQRLFYRGHELDDNSATMMSLGVLANDIFDLREDNEDSDALTDDVNIGPPKKQKKERGFGGTLLGGSSRTDVSTDESVNIGDADEKACPICTFSNPPDASNCEMCETDFAS